ncbi:hypothetical protein I0D00_11750 [Pseudomonas lalucatii]|uniref:Uncharacterized protein n=1 Tax=Pseudomonas lalucatii TaxID=1424203 RepID=A0ABS5Q1J0_9PSED|nr:hypothetical protein [Pseudomonas lalucatii]MBS7662606.1 hypothetical protein [Pseudomonas lalucatii]MBS7725805.1 hypothetical protein [Pseudomonas lalucatii]QVM88587.1 hypothetical protein I0D68_08930 [Pseudomonas lalucatii]
MRRVVALAPGQFEQLLHQPMLAALPFVDLVIPGGAREMPGLGAQRLPLLGQVPGLGRQWRRGFCDGAGNQRRAETADGEESQKTARSRFSRMRHILISP